MERIRTAAAAFAGAAPSDVRVVRSPYRVCPLGAHVDHQYGRVTGMAIDRSIMLGFVPTDEGMVRLRSAEFEGEVAFSLAETQALQHKGWARYAAGAVEALREAGYVLRRGVAGVIQGQLPIGGLSSSAAVTIAYLLALESANELALSEKENIRLEQYVENVYIGLKNGILDQSVILLSRQRQLLYLDCLDESWELLASSRERQCGIVVAYSGLSGALTSTGYNQRVAECEAAAAALLRLAGLEVPAQPRLRHVPKEAYEAHWRALPPALARRAKHFFTEDARVISGRQAWKHGDLETFGALVSESGRSSIENYECGSPELITLYEALCGCEGVYGARFSGAGFRGSCIGLYEPGAEHAIRSVIDRVFPQKHPHLAETYEVHFCQSADGASLL